MQAVYLIYDIGKTNKKVLVFSNDGEVIDEYTEQFAETTDEDGFPCDDLQKLSNWVLGQFKVLQRNQRYTIKAINFATYGASFVHINKEGNPLTPLYNYLKPLPQSIQEKFLTTHFHNDVSEFAINTASPLMGMLNSGLQLYWLKHTKPLLWKSVIYSLHLPQYLSYLFSGKPLSDYTSLGCHTGLWNINKKEYHSWVMKEEIDKKLAPVTSSAIAGEKEGIVIGTGLHDSSSALIPYLMQYKEPFLLISTGTWCINLNPFNSAPLTPEELQKDCLCYLQAGGNIVKASRIFLGREHEYQTKRIAEHFNTKGDFYKEIKEPASITNASFVPACMEGSGPVPQKQKEIWDFTNFQSASEAYTALMKGLTDLLKLSIDLVHTKNVQHFFIDGGFAANTLFRHFLKEHYPHITITAVEFPQATALGAYLNIKKAIT